MEARKFSKSEQRNFRKVFSELSYCSDSLHIQGDMVTFLLDICFGKTLRVRLFPSSNTEYVPQILKSYHNLIEVMVGKNVLASRVRALISTEQKKRISGFTTEYAFAERLQALSGLGIHKVEYGNTHSGTLDKQGIDVLVMRGDGTFPIQVKKNFRSAQEHFQKFPNIPLVIYNNKWTNQEFKEKMQQLFSRYKKNEKHILLD